MTKITIPYKNDINAILRYGMEQSKSYEGKFEGNSQSGNFSFIALGGAFSGNYIVNQNAIEIIFTKKPFFVPKAAIEQFLKLHIK